jgi:D-tyrosyl-tRNA(Tyr) deacylase
MIAVIQRVTEAWVDINQVRVGQIKTGFLVLLGIKHNDTKADAEWLAKKIIGMRIFGDADGKMNLDLSAINGDILLISQFTLYANTQKGNRPSFIEAARPEVAIPLYQLMIQLLSEGLGKDIQTGQFGADMQVSLLNDGPVTIVLESPSIT